LDINTIAQFEGRKIRFSASPLTVNCQPALGIFPTGNL
jgi:TRAP-type C4-dicarboxylate transport system substrate-binding protein